MSFARTPLRSSLRSVRPTALPKLASPARYGSSKAYAQQKMTGLPTAGLALAGLFGWTAVILSIGRPAAKHEHGHASPSPRKAASPAPSSPSTDSVPASTETDLTADSSSSDEAAESQSAAYDPVTGEINWACPCLGGMADGPCGEEFKAAFSCFVYSEEEVKGVDCVDKFRAMQDCFRKYPDVYGNQDDEEEDDDAELISRAEAALKEEDTFSSSST